MDHGVKQARKEAVQHLGLRFASFLSVFVEVEPFREDILLENFSDIDVLFRQHSREEIEIRVVITDEIFQFSGSNAEEESVLTLQYQGGQKKLLSVIFIGDANAESCLLPVTPYAASITLPVPPRAYAARR